MKITDIKEMLSEKCNFSGIKGCMTAGVLTAGIAAFAFISSVNSDSGIASVSAEDKAAEDGSVAAVPDTEEEKEYCHDREYFTYEEMMLMAMDKESDKESEETEAQAEAEETEAEETEAQPEESAENESEEIEAQPEESEAEETEAEETEAETQAEESEEESEEQPAETEAPADESAAENRNAVSERSSAANGDEDDGGLASALDIEIVPVPAAEYEPDPEFSFADAVLEAQAINESKKEDVSEEDGEPLAAVYENDSEEAEPAQTEEASEAEEKQDEQAEGSEEEDLSEIPEDITLDDEEDEKESVPQEGAISLFDLPQWLEFDENGLPTEYKEVLTGKACAYTAEPGALMSTGEAVFQGYVAVDPDIIPYGSELYIVAEDGEVYGYAIAGDTGYSVKAGHIIVDLFMNEYDDCIQWGNKPVYVYVLK